MASAAMNTLLGVFWSDAAMAPRTAPSPTRPLDVVVDGRTRGTRQREWNKKGNAVTACDLLDFDLR